MSRRPLLATAMILLSLAPDEAASAPCIDYRVYPRVVNSIDTDSTVRGSTLYEGYLLTASDDGLGVFSIEGDPVELVWRRTLGTPGHAFAIVVGDTIAYLADGDGGVAIIDVSHPEDPVYISSVDLPGSATALALADQHLYVVSSGATGSLQVVDVSDPFMPEALVGVDVGFVNYREGGIVVLNGFAYVANRSTSLWIFDVSQPDMPYLADEFPLPVYAEDVAFDQGYIYMAASYSGTGAAGLYVLDVSLPTVPFIAGSIFTPGRPSHVSVTAGVAAVSCRNAGIQIADVSNPVSPSLFGGVPLRADPQRATPVGEALLTPLMLGSIQVVDLGEATTPVPQALTTLPGSIHKIAIDPENDVAYVAQGVEVVDISDPYEPTHVRHVNAGGLAYDITLAGGYLYVPLGPNGLRVLDPVDPLFPSPRGLIDTPGLAVHVAVRGDLAYVCDISTVEIVDVSRPDLLSIVGSMNTPGAAWSLSIAGHVAYLADGDAGLHVLDLTTPDLPVIVETLPLSGTVRGIVLGDGVAFVNASGGGIHVVDVSVPTSPVLLTTVHIAGVPGQLDLEGDYLYAADQHGGMHVFDVADARNPIPIGGLYVHATNGVTVFEEAVYLASGFQGMYTVPAQCPATSVSSLLSYFEVEASVGTVRLTGALESSHELSRLRLSAHQEGQDRKLALQVSGNNFSALDEGVKGTVVYLLVVERSDVDTVLLAQRTVDVPTTSPRLRLEVSPNPFNPSTTVRFVAPAGREATIRAFDARGRMVAELYRGTASGVTQELAWKPRNLSSGVYSLRLETLGEVDVRTAVLLK